MFRNRFRPQQNGHCPVMYEDSSSSEEEYVISPPLKIPWRALSLAVFLLLVGLAFLFTASLIISGQINFRYYDRIRPLIILGCVMLVSGAYHVKVAYDAFKDCRIEYE